MKSRTFIFCFLLVVILVRSVEIFAQEETIIKPNNELLSGALNGDRYRVFITTDIGGGDDDDYQSLVHYFVYGDLFDTEGIIATPPKFGTVKNILQVVDLYEADYPKLVKHSDKYPSPAYYRAIAKQGSKAAPSEEIIHGLSYTDEKLTEGAKWLIECAMRRDPENRPLYVLIWGTPTDLAFALSAKPEIKENIRVIYLAGANELRDPHSIKYIETHHKDLWIVQNMYSFQGVRLGGNQQGDLDNFTFMQTHVKGHGAMGDWISLLKGGEIKMGDTPTVLYLLKGNPDDPTLSGWGGKFIKRKGTTYKNWYVDIMDPEFMLYEFKSPRHWNAEWWGAKITSSWREEWLRDWQERMDRIIIFQE
ncbi:MAG: nucleoside hydrolase-like domain-containing protein [Bacteroidales bacterium]